MKNVHFLFPLSEILLPIALLFGACDKSDPVTPATVQETLTNGVWTTFHELEDTDKNGSFVDFTESCDTDNSWTFYENGNYDTSVGPVSCEPDIFPPNTVYTFTYALENNDNTLVIQFPGDETRFQIVSITDSELVLDEVDDNNPTAASTHRIVLNR